MNKEELNEYFLEKAGYYKAYSDYRKQYNISRRVFESSKNPNSAYGKVLALYNKLEYLEMDNAYLLFESDELYFNEYKTTIKNILKIIPNDYDLKKDLILKGIDYKTFDKETFKNFKSIYYREKIYNEIRCECPEEKDPLKLQEYALKKAKKLGFDSLDYYFNFNISKLDDLKDELLNIIKEKEIDEYDFGSFPDFLLGRMYLRIESIYLEDFCNKVDEETLKKRYKILLEIKEHDFYSDYLNIYNEIGFASYHFKDFKTYDYVRALFSTKSKKDVMSYFLKYIEEICDGKNDNLKYIKEIASRNLFFIPMLTFRYGYASNVYNIYQVNKGSFEEACKMTHYFLTYINHSFDNLENIFFKDFFFDLKKYFNFVFLDQELSYIMFKELSNLYMNENKKSYYIDEFKKDFLIKNKLRFNDYDFEITFKKMFESKLIKKCANQSFYFQKGIEILIQIDMDGNPEITNLLNFDKNSKKIDCNFDDEIEIDEDFINKFKA